jgi:hypothetical protein
MVTWGELAEAAPVLARTGRAVSDELDVTGRERLIENRA